MRLRAFRVLHAADGLVALRCSVTRPGEQRHTSAETVADSNAEKEMRDMTDSHEKHANSAVVVGVDTSPGSLEALRWALAEARLRQCPLRVVHAWSDTFMSVAVGGYGYLPSCPVEAGSFAVSDGLQRGAEELVEQVIDEVEAPLGVDIERSVVGGRAGEVLVATSNQNDLLVVGSREHGGVVGLLLGSVREHCAHHARCPVVVVHPHNVAVSHEGAADPSVARRDAA